MIDGREIVRILDDMTARARRARLAPAVPTLKHREAWAAGADLAGPGFRFPRLGDYVRPGWEEIERYFVDTSGFGNEGEPAMTQSRLARLMAASPPHYGWGLVEEGQFQGYVASFQLKQQSWGVSPVKRKGAAIAQDQKK